MTDSYNKKTLQQKKAKKKQDKIEQRKERKMNNNKGKSLEEMLTYVDEFGNLTDTPPEQQNRQEINMEDIQLGAAPVSDEPNEYTGVVSSFIADKAYGFIVEDNSGESVFVHSNNSEEELKQNDKVIFEKERTPKGYAAIRVRKVK